ncbi:MAG: type II toxin-antitoxin system HipA family toxin [Noviherbaspirillum sp.]
MTSELAIFIHLPGENEAVPAGILAIDEAGATVLASSFVYGTRYLERKNRVEIDPVGLGLMRGQTAKGVRLFPPPELALFGGIRDAAPDAWGRRVIENRFGAPANGLPESRYLLHAGHNRVGALDIRPGLTTPYDSGGASSIKRLEYLLEAADAIEAGMPVPANLQDIFDAGTSLGGMRPKAAVVDGDRHWLAKFPSRQDRGFSVPVIEYACMRLAAECGLDVPEVRLLHVGNDRPVMLIERFDRMKGAAGTTRRHFVTALTLLGVHESRSPEMSYTDIAQKQALYGAPQTIRKQQSELFGRMVFNIFVSNDDDHLRNHGFLWHGDGWVLSPLYDVVPRASLAFQRNLHLGVGAQGRNATLVNAMSKHAMFGLDRPAALAIIDRIWRVVREWRSYFEGWEIPGADIVLAAPAFRHADDIGGKDIGL